MVKWLAPFMVATIVAATDLPLKLETKSGVRSRLANVHLTSDGTVDGRVTVVYGSCVSDSPRDSLQTISTTELGDIVQQRLVWVVPEDAQEGDCISAFGSSGTLLGRSEPQTLQHHWRKRALKKRTGTSFEFTHFVLSSEAATEVGIRTHCHVERCWL